MTQKKSKTHSNFGSYLNSGSNNLVVIGGGLSGLASAALLAKLGWQVTLLEKNSTLGGRARVMKKAGFAFDMGPSWYMMPEVFDRFFALFGKKTSDFYELIKLEPRYTVLTDDNQKLTLTNNQKQNEQLFDQLEPGAGRELREVLSRLKDVYNASTTHLMYQDVWNPQTWLNGMNWRLMWKVASKLQFWRSWQKELEHHFKHPLIKKILGFPAVFLGGSPYDTPSLFSILTWSDFGTGIWYPKGGMIKVVTALEQLAVSQGVTILKEQEVVAIELDQGRAVGVRTSSNYFPASVVVGAMDLPWLETQLLPKRYQNYPETYWKKKILGISAYMFYLGFNKRLPKLTHHTLYFTQDWQKNFDEIFKDKKLPSDPSLYISIRSKTDRSIVPPGAEEVMVLVPIAAESYTAKELKLFGKKVLSKIETVLGVKIDEHCVVKEAYTPHDFSQDYRAYNGAAMGLAHTLTQSLWFRPNNKSNKVKGLYYAGQYTNPGIGVPMALVSAQIVSKMIGEPENPNKQIFKKGSTTYYYSSLFFRGQAKKDVFALYAYVRVIDDLVDQAVPQIDELEKMWQATLKAWKGEISHYQFINDFVELAKRKRFKWEWIKSFWQAMRNDLVKNEYSNFPELEEYMYGSAEVIGLMMARLLGLPKAAMKAAAVQGKAMQLLNFIRDIDEDHQLGRKYLNYKESWRCDEQKWRSFIVGYLEKYYQLQSEAEKGYQYIPKHYLVPIKTAAEMYLKTAQTIKQNPMIVWQKKVKPSKLEVLLRVVVNVFSL